MSRARKPIRTRKTASPLLSPEGTGGIVAGNGFDFQTRYAVCELPGWLVRGLIQMLHEGTGDIDLHFDESRGACRIHIQVKDHEVAPAEFKTAVAHFSAVDGRMQGVYQSFVLACPTLSPRLRPIEAALARYRGAAPFYAGASDALASTREEVVRRLKQIGLDDQLVAFVLDKVSFDVGHADLEHDDRALDRFASRILSHPTYAQRQREMVLPAFSELLRAVGSRRGVVLDRATIEAVLTKAILTGVPERPAVTIWFHNWTVEQFDLPADRVVDWSSHFERASRRTPTPQVWGETLLPELQQLRIAIAAERPDRLIRFRGKCALSSGWAIGAAFPVAGGWAFEISQPPAREVWKSDDVPTPDYAVQIEVAEGDAVGTDLVLAVGIKGDARTDVANYVAAAGIHPRLTIYGSPESQGTQAIGSSADACAFAVALRDHVGAAIKKFGIRRTHVFYYGPLALAIFLGQQFTAVGEIQLYEYQDPGYTPSCSIKT